MPPTRTIVDRCAACDGALRAAPRSVVRAIPLVHCQACGHWQIEREPDFSVGTDTIGGGEEHADAWSAFEEGIRRVRALRALGVGGGRLLDVGDDLLFAGIAAAAPFDVTRAGLRDGGDGLPVPSLLSMIEKEENPSSRFRVVTLWNGLASEPDPVALLERLHRLLEPGGMLALAVPVTVGHEPTPSLLGLPRSPGSPRTHPAIGARHVFSRTSLRVAVLRAGFDIEASLPAGGAPTTERLPIHKRLFARGAHAGLSTLRDKPRFMTRTIPDVLWRTSDAVELWAVRSVG